MILHWEGQEYEAVKVDEMLVGEVAACEKWLGVSFDRWGTAQQAMCMTWVTLKRRNPQFPRSRVEGIPMGKLLELLVPSPEDIAAGEAAQGEADWVEEGGGGSDPTPAATPPAAESSPQAPAAAS